MHSKLLSDALQSAWTWVALIAAGPAIIPAAILGLVLDSPVVALVVWVLIVGCIFLSALLPPIFEPRVSQLQGRVRDAAVGVQGRADGVCIALGLSPIRVLEFDHQSRNVGYLKEAGEPRIVVTSGAIAALSLTELEALIASVMSVHTNKGIIRLLRVVQSISIGRSALFWGWITIPLAFIGIPFALIFWAVAVFFLFNRLIWWVRIVSDAATIETTRFPDPLPNALCKVALYNDAPVPMGRLSKWFGTVDLYWVAPLSTNKAPLTTSTDAGTVSATSVEMDADLRLVLSAQLVSEVLVEGKPPTMETFDRCIAEASAARRGIVENQGPVEIGDYIIDTNGLRPKPGATPS